MNIKQFQQSELKRFDEYFQKESWCQECAGLEKEDIQSFLLSSIEKAYALGKEERECKHTKQPESYVAWHYWAEKKSKTHKQIRCPKCGLWKIWVINLLKNK